MQQMQGNTETWAGEVHWQTTGKTTGNMIEVFSMCELYLGDDSAWFKQWEKDNRMDLS